MSNFHSRIMNLPFDRPISSPEYATGHRDARHAAAEIGNEADALAARLAEAERLLRQARDDFGLGANLGGQVADFLRNADSASPVRCEQHCGTWPQCTCGGASPYSNAVCTADQQAAVYKPPCCKDAPEWMAVVSCYPNCERRADKT
jgi:hypothetical protein